MSPQPARILLVDDDPSLGEMLGIVLRQEGFEPVFVRSGDQAIAAFHQAKPDLVLLDLMLPGKDGLEICRELRLESGVPIVMLTAKTDTVDVVLGLESGADDYITKPFSMREFRSRVKAVLRRSDLLREEQRDEEPLTAGDLSIDFAKRTVEIRGEPVRLTYVEFEILSILARNPGRVFSRTMILDRLWGDSSYRDPRTIDVHIRHLREKIERDPKDPEFLFTVRGVGYHFRDR